MGKKKKIKKLAKSSIQILQNGKIKVSKNQKIDLKPYITESIQNTVVSRLEGIISKEDVVLETADLRLDSQSHLTSDLDIANLSAHASSAITNTIVLTVPKKKALESFNFLTDGTLGELLRTSTLASVYKAIKDKWVSLNENDNTVFTNVLYVPDVVIFIDPNTGSFNKKPYKINVIILAIPSPGKMTLPEDEITLTDEDVVKRIVEDEVDAAIKLGCKDLIINPFNNKILSKNPDLAAKRWFAVTTSQRCIEQVHSIYFGIEREDLYITFNAARMPSLTEDPSIL